MNPLLTPVWEGDTVLNESLLPLRDVRGNICPMRLLYEASEILSVRSMTLETVYEPECDYLLRDGCLILPESTRIPVMEYADYYPKVDDGHSFARTGGGFIRFGEEDYFHRRQIAVSYRHRDTWPFETPKDKSALLPRTAKRLRSGAPLKLLIFGDSISVGLNASGTVGVPPYQKPWFDLAADALREAMPGRELTLFNTSVVGKTSLWGRETARENAADLCPDLCVIAFGMNDGTAQKPPEDFINNLTAIIRAVSQRKRECEFILVSTTLANKEAKGFAGLQESYLNPMLRLEESGICVADMTSLHRALLFRKRFCDMTGNNVNHPNDFLSRVYAQLLLRTLGAL